MRRLFVVALSMLLLAGCAHIISDKSRAMADRSVTFSQLKVNPDSLRGKFVILGGAVTGVLQLKEGVRLEVIQYPLDMEEIPDNSSDSGGRFLVDLPPDVGYSTFKPGMLVTMAGEVAGKMVKPLDKADYTYPVIVVKEIHMVVPSRPSYRTGY